MLRILHKNKVFWIAALALLLIAIGVFRHIAAPENCALCGGLKHHAPCLVNLSTGQVGELAIYEPHPTLVGEIAEEQTGGLFAFLPCAGLTAIQDGDSPSCSVEIPDSHKKLNSQYFCRTCRDLLESAKGYVLADLYDLKQIRVYSIEDGAEYDIRDYHVSIQWDVENECNVMVNRPHSVSLKSESN